MTIKDKPYSRREFARRAAIGTAAFVTCSDLAGNATSAPLLHLRELVQVDAETGVTATACLKPPGQNPAAPKLSPQSQAEADSRYQAIINQYGDRFSDAQKTDLKRLCIFVQPPLDRIRAYTISNDDLPALYLKPLVDRDKKSAINSKTSSPGAAKSSPKS
jgi:hypothetical protein